MLEKLTHNWSLKLLALAIAVAMWVFVVGQEKSEISVRVPVEITNIPAEALVVDDVLSEVDVRLYGPRTLIRRVAAERLSKAVDLTGLGLGTHVFQVQSEDLRLPPGVRVLRISPDTFTITLARRITREAQVRPVFKGKPAEGFDLGEVTFKPDKVTVVGSREDLNDLDWIWTLPIDLNERKEPFSQMVQLRPPRGRSVRLSRTDVEVHVNIQARPAPEPREQHKNERKPEPKGKRN